MRVRLRYTKLGKVRFVSHRDVARLCERALRRVDVAVAYTQGFSPRPKLHFGLALPTGYESLAEYVDVDLAEEAEVPIEQLPAHLDPALPEGVDVVVAAALSRDVISLQQAVTSCTWRIVVEGAPTPEVAAAVDAAMAASDLPCTRERKGREVTDDLRPQILDLRVIGARGAGTEIEAELGTQPRSVRPRELVGVLDAPLAERTVLRTHQWMTLDGVRREPLPVAPGQPDQETTPIRAGSGAEPLARPTPRAPRAQARAS